MKTAFSIIRVSAQDQLRGYGPKSQIEDDLIPNAPLFELSVIEKYTRVIQESATGWERVKFEALMKEALLLFRSGEIQALYFPRVDRETRFIFSSFPLLAEVVRAGLPVYFARERLLLDPCDSESVERYLMKTVQSQAYIETMKMNCMRGLRKKGESGKFTSGHRAKLYGYTYIKGAGPGQGVRIINETESPVVREIFRLYVEGGSSCLAIAQKLNVEGIPSASGIKWSAATIHDTLINEAYTGKTVIFKDCRRGNEPHPIELPGVTPALISREVFEQVQTIRKRNKIKAKRNSKAEYLLSGLMVCDVCGRPYWASVKRGPYSYYRCASRCRWIAPTNCGNKNYAVKELEAMVWKELEEQLSDEKKWDTHLDGLTAQKAASEPMKAELRDIEKNLKALDRDQSKLLQLVMKGFPVEMIEAENLRINKSRESLKSRQQRTVEALDNSKQASNDLIGIRQALQALNTGDKSFKNKRRILELLKITVHINQGKIDLTGRLKISNYINSTSVEQNQSITFTFRIKQKTPVPYPDKTRQRTGVK